MKKSRVIILTMLVLVIFLLASCVIPTYSKRTNKMIPGYFEGYGTTKENENGEEYNEFFGTLTVKEITEEEFNEAKGKNTVYDEVGEKYYYIEFSYKGSNEETVNVEFKNMRDAYNGAIYQPIDYCDDNGNWIKPPLDKSYVVEIKIDKDVSIYFGVSQRSKK